MEHKRDNEIPENIDLLNTIIVDAIHERDPYLDVPTSCEQPYEHSTVPSTNSEQWVHLIETVQK